MLKWLLMVLIAANGAFFAWTQGWLDNVVGVRAIGDREPGRMAQQVRPESVIVLSASAVAAQASPSSAAPASAAASGSSGAASAVGAAGATSAAASGASATGGASVCLEAGPFNTAELTSAETTLTGLLPASAWSRVAVEAPGAWAVYMGPYVSADLRTKKEAELRRRRLRFESFKLPPEVTGEQRAALAAKLIPGLSLGRYPSLENAEAALVKFGGSGVHSARVIELFKPYSAQNLRIGKADAALATRLKGLTGSAALSKPFVVCP